MTTILPSQRSPLDAIAALMGQSLQQTLPQAAQQAGQRQQGLNAIDQLQKEIEAANGDPLKALPALMKAYTLNPSLERSGIAEKALALGQRQRGAEEFKAGKTTASGHPLKGEANKETPISVTDLVQPRESFVADPQGVSKYQQPFGPEEIANIRNQARARNFLPDLEERYVNDALEYNKIAQNRRDIELQNYDQAQKQRRDTLENQAAFEKYLTEHSPEFAKNPDELELALKASQNPKYQKLESFADRNAAVKNEIRPYQAEKKALNKALQRPLFGYSNEQRNLVRQRAQRVVEMGQKPQLQLMIANNGHGEVEEAELLNPLPYELEDSLKRMSPLIKVSATSSDPDSPEFKKSIQERTNHRNKQLDNFSNFLSEEIVPGTYDKPGTNLLLTRYNLMEKKASWDEAGRIIDKAIQEGNIKLDPQQKIDYQKLAYPPLTGESYADTILNNIMFPITGKQ